VAASAIRGEPWPIRCDPWPRCRTNEPLTGGGGQPTVSGMPTPVPNPAGPLADACAEVRQQAALRCEEARAAGHVHAAAVERTRLLRRDLVAATHRRDAAETAAAPGPRRAEKDRARQLYLAAREAATTDGERSEAAATWARELDRINRASRLAARSLAKARAALQVLEQSARESERTEQTLRIQAEAAEAACLDARVRLAGCEERLLGAVLPVPGPAAVLGQGAFAGPAGAHRATRPPQVMPPMAPPPPVPVGFGAAAPAPAGPAPGFGPGARPSSLPASNAAFASASTVPLQPATVGQEAPHVLAEPHSEPLVIESMVSGDRLALDLAAAAIGERARLGAAEIRVQLQELVDAVVSAASEAGYLVFDTRHPFWAQLSEMEAADVVSGLSRLGFRFEPAEGWHAGRAPAPADLAMALAYAGLDTRLRRSLPGAEELRLLPRSIGVDARAWLAAFAPDLDMEQLVRLLESRAAKLGPLWDAWGLVRPVLLGPRHQLGSLPG
jgi:hypothetical protein